MSVIDYFDKSSFGGVVGKNLTVKVVREEGKRIGDSEYKQILGYLAWKVGKDVILNRDMESWVIY